MTLYGVWSMSAADADGYDLWDGPNGFVYCTHTTEDPSDLGDRSDAVSVGEITRQIPLIPIELPTMEKMG